MTLVAQRRNQHALIVLGKHSAAHNIEHALRLLPGISRNLQFLVPIFCKGFRENSQASRTAFFANRVAQLLWRQFVAAKERFIADYFSELAAMPNDNLFARALLMNMLELSELTNFEVLGPQHPLMVDGRFQHADSSYEPTY